MLESLLRSNCNLGRMVGRSVGRWNEFPSKGKRWTVPYNFGLPPLTFIFILRTKKERKEKDNKTFPLSSSWNVYFLYVTTPTPLWTSFKELQSKKKKDLIFFSRDWWPLIGVGALQFRSPLLSSLLPGKYIKQDASCCNRPIPKQFFFLWQNKVYFDLDF